MLLIKDTVKTVIGRSDDLRVNCEYWPQHSVRFGEEKSKLIQTPNLSPLYGNIWQTSLENNNPKPRDIGKFRKRLNLIVRKLNGIEFFRDNLVRWITQDFQSLLVVKSAPDHVTTFQAPCYLRIGTDGYLLLEHVTLSDESLKTGHNVNRTHASLNIYYRYVLMLDTSLPKDLVDKFLPILDQNQILLISPTGFPIID